MQALAKVAGGQKAAKRRNNCACNAVRLSGVLLCPPSPCPSHTLSMTSPCAPPRLFIEEDDLKLREAGDAGQDLSHGFRCRLLAHCTDAQPNQDGWLGLGIGHLSGGDERSTKSTEPVVTRQHNSIFGALLSPNAWKPCSQTACLAGPICKPAGESIPTYCPEFPRSKASFQSSTGRARS